MLNELLVSKMAALIDRRGFLLYDDVFGEVPCDDGHFASVVREHESEIRKHGYTGGQLASWSTSFRYPEMFAYGVVDGDWYYAAHRRNDVLIDAYAFAVTGLVERSDLTVGQAGRLMLGLEFQCTCGHRATVACADLGQKLQGELLRTVRGACRGCGAGGLDPSGAAVCYRLA